MDPDADRGALSWSRRGPRERGPLLLALVIACAVLLTRGALMARAHSESYDDEFHLVRGARFFLGTLHEVSQTDPPLGEAITALPMVLTNRNPAWVGTLYDHSSPPERTMFLVALWRSLLFLPVAGIAFVWCRSLYGPAAGWLGLALLLAEPTFAAHIPLAAIDALGVAGVVGGVWLLWRWYERPTAGRFAAAAFGVAGALLVKHTAVLLPVVALLYGLLWWVVRPRRAGAPWAEVRSALPRRLAALGAGALATAGAIWTLLLFDVRRPDIPSEWRDKPGAIVRLLDRPLPAGTYIGSVLRADWHDDLGHRTFLLGQKRRGGWWYYFPVVLFYKMPIGIAGVLLLAGASLVWARPRFEEWGLVVPLVLWTGLMLATRINIGLRHFLPAYIFMLLLGARCLAPRSPTRSARAEGPPRAAAVAAWVGTAAAAVHALAWHPDYIAYVNWPRPRVWMDISDSNVDWGQGLKQARHWIDAHPETAGRRIHLLYFGDPNSPRRVVHYLGRRAIPIRPPTPLPGGGLLIASPVWVAGPFDDADLYAPLRSMTPIDVIGGTLLVYDLDRPGTPGGRTE